MTTIVADIRQAARASPAASIDWPDRGPSPRGYVEGMAVAFARVLCKHAQGDPAVLEMATAQRPDAVRDALAHYDAIFVQNGMDNSQAGRDTLRHLFVLLVGLGMRESSGQHCEGRDMSAENVTAETAEAGLFQTSWDARTAHALLVPLFTAYRAHPSGFIEIFRQGVTCSAESWQNWGEARGSRSSNWPRNVRHLPPSSRRWA